MHRRSGLVTQALVTDGCCLVGTPPSPRSQYRGCMRGNLIVLPTDLTWVRVNGGRGFASMSNWDGDGAPVVGQRVLAADGGSERIEAVVAEVRSDTIVLEFPQFVRGTGQLETRREPSA